MTIAVSRRKASNHNFISFVSPRSSELDNVPTIQMRKTKAQQFPEAAHLGSMGTNAPKSPDMFSKLLPIPV